MLGQVCKETDPSYPIKLKGYSDPLSEPNGH